MSAESTVPDPYELVLADLRAKKIQIEQAIATIEALRSGQPAPASPAPSENAPAQGSSTSVDGPGAFLGMSIVDAAKALLASKRKPMRNPDIAAAFKAGGLVLNSREPANTVGSVLTRRFSEVGDVVRVDRRERSIGVNRPEFQTGTLPFFLCDVFNNCRQFVQRTPAPLVSLALGGHDSPPHPVPFSR